MHNEKNIETTIERLLVCKVNDRYFPFFSPDEINRDNFIHLRRQLVKLGCTHNKVLDVARRMCMDLLNFDREEDYLQYVSEDTLQKCQENIKDGYDPCPIQDLQNLDYSHVNLFSSIYGYEIEHLKSRGICSNIADIGCGEGILSKIANDHFIEIDSYEVVKPIFCLDEKIKLIEDYQDINKNYKCLIFNHVLEHIQIKPDDYLELVINHFDEHISNDRLKVIFISLPMHTHIHSHIASKHYWVCTNETFLDEEERNSILQNNLNIFYPTIAFSKIAKRFKFMLTVKNEIGVYVFER